MCNIIYTILDTGPGIIDILTNGRSEAIKRLILVSSDAELINNSFGQAMREEQGEMGEYRSMIDKERWHSTYSITYISYDFIHPRIVHTFSVWFVDIQE